MADIDDDAGACPALSRDGVVERGIGLHHEIFEIGTFAAGAQADARKQVRRRGLYPRIDAEIDPIAFKRFQNGAGNAGFAGTRRAVEDDDPAAQAAPSSPPNA
jgi:hypothetical protein